MNKLTNKVSDLSSVPVYADKLNELIDEVNAISESSFDLVVDKTTSDGFNVAIGEDALSELTGGVGNIAIGEDALKNTDHTLITGGSSNIGIGNNTGSAITIGEANICIGGNAGSATTLSEKYNNLFIGYNCGITGSQLGVNNSIALGYENFTTKNNQVVLGNSSVIETVTRGVHINTHTKTAKNVTATLTAAECLAGVITSTSVAAVNLTLPAASSVYSVLAGGQGTTFELIIDNSAGANSVTITPSATIAAITSPFTVTNPMIVTTAQKVGCFKFYFISSTAAVITRVW